MSNDRRRPKLKATRRLDEMVGEWAEETIGDNIERKKNVDFGFLMDPDPFAIWIGFNHNNKWAS